MNRKGHSGQYKKGQSGNPAGRPKGAVNQTTALVREFAAQLWQSTSYTRYLTHRIETGQAPAMERYFAELLGGKPKEEHAHTGTFRITWEASS